MTELPELRDAHESSRLGVYLRELYERRSYINHVATNELKSRQITNVLGNFWHLLNPALSIAVYYLIFGLLLDTGRTENFILFLTVGLFIYQTTQKSTTDGAKAIVTNKGVIKAVRFPRALLPISSTWTEFLASFPNYLVIFTMAMLTGVAPRWSWLALVPLALLQLVFNTGAAMIAARLTTHFVDMIQILPFVFRLLFYGSGVIFSVEAYVESDSAVSLLFELNPLYAFVTLARWSVMGGGFEPLLLLSATVWSLILLVFGFFWFRAAEETYARD